MQYELISSELVKQHRIHCIVSYAVGFAFLLAHYQAEI
jgi:hypothetical protein